MVNTSDFLFQKKKNSLINKWTKDLNRSFTEKKKKSNKPMYFKKVLNLFGLQRMT